LSRMRVLLAEDHGGMQAMLAVLLQGTFDICATLSDGEAVLLEVARTLPDAIVLDISLPGRSGLLLLPELRQCHPALWIVIFTTHADPLYRREAMARGANAYVLKQDAGKELCAALHRSRREQKLQGHPQLLRACTT
jgi:DNA-binding NarL/FixJ family response regulator